MQNFLFVKAKAGTEWEQNNVVFIHLYTKKDCVGVAKLSDSPCFSASKVGWTTKISQGKKAFIYSKTCRFPPLHEAFWHEFLVYTCPDVSYIEHEVTFVSVFEYGVEHGGLMLATLRNGGVYMGFENSSKTRKEIEKKLTAMSKSM